MRNYTLSTERLRVSALSKGATITQIQVFKDGEWHKTLLDYENIDNYKNEDPYYLNCVVGPHAGRIKNGEYTLNGESVYLERNNKGNHHHGGSHSFKDILFDVEEKEHALIFSAHDAFHDIDIRVELSVEDSNLKISYKAIPGHPQVINMTHHLYFNLSDEKTIKNHRLHTLAPYVHEVDETGASTHKILEVEGTPFDFTEKPRLGERIDMSHPQFDYTRNIDHAFYTKMMPLYLESDKSKVGVKIESSSDFTVLYTANFFDGEASFVDRGPSQRYESIAIESQDLPNGVNIPGTKNQIYSEERPYTQTTTFSFYTIS